MTNFFRLQLFYQHGTWSILGEQPVTVEQAAGFASHSYGRRELWSRWISHMNTLLDPLRQFLNAFKCEKKAKRALVTTNRVFFDRYICMSLK